MLQRSRAVRSAAAIAACLLLAALLAAGPAAPSAQAAGIDPAVYEALAAAPDGQTSFWVYFRARPDLSGAAAITQWAARGSFVTSRLQAAARASQAGVRDVTPYFLPPGEGVLADTLAATGGAMAYDDAGRLGDAAVNHFWLARGVIAGGASGPSNRVGEFDFLLVPGS